MPAHKITGALTATFTHEHHLDLRVAMVLFKRGTAYLNAHEMDLAESFRDLGYEVELVDEVPTDYLAGAEHAHATDNRVLVPRATP